MNKTFSISEALSFGWNQFKSHWKFWLIVFVIAMGSSYTSGQSFSPSSYSRSNNSTSSYSSYSKNKAMPEFDAEKVLGSKTTSTSDVNIMPYSDPKKVTPLKENSSFPGILLAILIPYGVVAGLGLLFLVLLASLTETFLQMGLIHLTVDVARGGNLDYKTLLSEVSVKKAVKYIFASILVVLAVVLGLILFIIPGIYLAFRLAFVPYLVVDKNLGIGDAFGESAKLTKGIKLKLLAFEFIGIFVVLLGLIAFIVGVVPAIIVLNLATAYIYVTVDKQNTAPVVAAVVDTADQLK